MPPTPPPTTPPSPPIPPTPTPNPGLIDQAALTIGAVGSLTYGDAPKQLTVTGGSGTGAVTYAVTGGDAVSVNANTGAMTVLKAGTVTVTATKVGDDRYNAISASITLTVAKRTLRVAAVNQSIAFGAAVPSFSCTYDGFVNGENQSVLSGSPMYSCAYTPGSAAGAYDIQIFAGSLSAPNYEFVFSKGVLSVGLTQQAPLSPRTADGKTSYVYGTTGVTLTTTGGSGTGAVTYAVTGGDAVLVNANTGTVTIQKVGTATVTATKAGDGNYNATSGSITLTVAKRALTLSAGGTGVTLTPLNPATGITVSGLAGTDTAAVSMTALTGLTLTGNTLTYDGTTAFTNTSVSLSFTADAGTNYTPASQTLTITLIDGQADSRPIPVNQTNIQTFNGYANTPDGLTRHYKLTGSADLSGIGWTPIGDGSNPFTGSFDGGGHTISNLIINRPSDNYQGLFGYVDFGGVVKNVGLLNGSVTGNNSVGGVAGCNAGGTVQNCYNTGAVNGGDAVGGVVGDSGGTVQNCYNTGAVSGTGDIVGGVVGGTSSTVENSNNTGTVTGNNIVGGVVGQNYYGTVENCHNTGAVNGGYYVGGVAGENAGTVRNCYNTGAVNGNEFVGGVTGGNGGTVRNCVALNETVVGNNYVGRVVGFYDFGTLTNNYAWSGMTLTDNGFPIPAVPDPTYLDGEDISAAALKTQAAWTTAGFSFGAGSPWTWTGTYMPSLSTERLDWPAYLANQLGSGTAADPFIVSNVATLQRVGSNIGGWGLDKHYKMTANITLPNPTVTEGNWTPIGGTYANPFTGTFDGGGFTISNLIINRPADNNQGLFGYIYDAVVKNVGLLNSDITGDGGVGGVVGNNDDGTVQNCHNTGGYVTGTTNVGGIVGRNSAGTVQYCYNNGAVTGTGNQIGGVVGNNQSDTNPSVVQYCYNTGSVSSGADRVGGVVGQNSYSAAKVSFCYNTGNVSGNSYVGGVVGWIQGGIVENCVALNETVTGTSYISRVVGSNSATLLDNYGRVDMIVPGGVSSGPNGDDGADVTTVEYQNPAWWTDPLTGAGFPNDPWWDWGTKAPAFALSMPGTGRTGILANLSAPAPRKDGDLITDDKKTAGARFHSVIVSDLGLRMTGALIRTSASVTAMTGAPKGRV